MFELLNHFAASALSTAAPYSAKEISTLESMWERVPTSGRCRLLVRWGLAYDKMIFQLSTSKKSHSLTRQKRQNRMSPLHWTPWFIQSTSMHRTIHFQWLNPSENQHLPWKEPFQEKNRLQTSSKPSLFSGHVSFRGVYILMKLATTIANTIAA